MTLDEFIKDILGADASKYSQKEIEVYFEMSAKLFNTLFDKWKKEKLSLVEAKK